MIDTHIWVWLTENRDRLSQEQQAALSANEEHVFISAISIWEVAMLIQRGRLTTTMEMQQWIDHALLVGSIGVIELTPPIVCDATTLPNPSTAILRTGSSSRRPGSSIAC